jgi:hypothetical protein
MAELDAYYKVEGAIRRVKEDAMAGKCMSGEKPGRNESPECLVNVLSHSYRPQYMIGELDVDMRGISSSDIAELGNEFDSRHETISADGRHESIAAALLNQTTLAKLSKVMRFECIRQCGDHLHNFVPRLLCFDSPGKVHDHLEREVRQKGSATALVLLLNSEYTGGELEISHNGQTEVVTGAYRWVAMYGDCLHKINPVTSGTRVSLIFDIVLDRPMSTVYWPSSSFYRTNLEGRMVGFKQGRHQPFLNGVRKEMESLDELVIVPKDRYAPGVTTEELDLDDRMMCELLRKDYDVAIHPYMVLFLHEVDAGDRIAAQRFTSFDNDAPDDDAALVGRSKIIFPAHVSADYQLHEEVRERDDWEADSDDLYMVSGLRVRKRRHIGATKWTSKPAPKSDT